eukprot:1056520-Alexandrium_andersonii.AAC.1
MPRSAGAGDGAGCGACAPGVRWRRGLCRAGRAIAWRMPSRATGALPAPRLPRGWMRRLGRCSNCSS